MPLVLLADAACVRTFDCNGELIATLQPDAGYALQLSNPDPNPNPNPTRNPNPHPNPNPYPTPLPPAGELLESLPPHLRAGLVR